LCANKVSKFESIQFTFQGIDTKLPSVHRGVVNLGNFFRQNLQTVVIGRFAEQVMSWKNSSGSSRLSLKIPDHFLKFYPF
jgi:hypothetical protein